MHVTACLAGQKVDVEVGEECRTLQALQEAVVEALPQLCVEGFDVSVGGRALDDEGVVSLTDNVCLDVSANARGLSVLELREAGREVSETGLLAAAAEGDVSLVTLYLDAGVPLDCVNAAGTPLHISCRGGHEEIARLLLDRGSTAIDERSRRGRTPLHSACRVGHLEIARLLLDRGSNAIHDARGTTPLHDACWHGHSQVVRLLLDRGINAIDEKNGDDDTPLHHACWKGHLEIARLLLDRGSNAIDAKNRDGRIPLHLSCDNRALGSRERLEIATLLLDRGNTTIDEEDRHGRTPLHLSCCSGDSSLVTLLLDRGCFVDEKAVEKLSESSPREVLEQLSERLRTQSVLTAES